MKILSTSDIHQMPSKWKNLVNACKKEQPDIVAVAGDLFPKTGIEEHFSFIPHLKKYAQKIKDLGSSLVLMLGNDDNQLLIPEMQKGEDDKLWVFLHNKVEIIKDYEFAGMPYVPDYPFGYKYWCRGEFKDYPKISDVQFCDPLIINDNNKFETIRNYPQYLKEHKSIYEELNELVAKVKNINNSIWLIHAPPSDLFLDVCSSGHKVGSKAVLQFIKEQQPLITIHGHIHESPEYNGHKYLQSEGKTACIQAGQMDFELYYCIMELDDNKIIKNIKHSIYG